MIFRYSVGSAPVISYHYGAGNKEELKSLLSKSLKLLGVTALVMTAMLWTRKNMCMFKNLLNKSEERLWVNMNHYGVI